MSKPYKGKIQGWTKLPCGPGLGFFVCGEFLDHPDFGNKVTHTSWVVAHDEATGEIETRNSRYTLVGPEIKPAS